MTTTDKTFSNPVSFNVEGITNPDPFVLSYRGDYYCYSTDESGVQVSRSADLINWEYLGLAFTEEGRRAFWAPNVVYRNGLFYLYVSDRPAGAEDPHLQRLRVATSETPKGPFTHRHRLKDYFAIDADVVFDRGGAPYLFYASNEFTEFDPDHPGTGIVVQEMADMLTLTGEPRPVIVPTLVEEVFKENRFGDGRDWHTIEGGAYFTRRGLAYMTYSGNAYVRENYFIGYATAKTAGDLYGAEWTKHPDNQTFHPLMRKNEAVEGTGHNSVIQAPNLVDWWIIYHGRDADQPLLEDVEQRVMRIDPLTFRGPNLETAGPSSSHIPAPREAGFTDRFDTESLGGWTVAGAVTGNPAERAVTLGSGGRMGLGTPVGPFKAQVDLRFPGQSGVSSFEIVIGSGKDTTAVTIDTETNQISGDSVSETVKYFHWTAWQPVIIERTLTTLVVRRGEQLLIEVPHELGSEPARIAFKAVRGAAQLGHFALTETFDWWEGQPGKNLVVKEGAAGVISLVGEVPTNSEVILDFELDSADSSVILQGTSLGEIVRLTGTGGRDQTVTVTRGEVELTTQAATEDGSRKEVHAEPPTRLALTAQLQGARLSAVSETKLRSIRVAAKSGDLRN